MILLVRESESRLSTSFLSSFSSPNINSSHFVSIWRTGTVTWKKLVFSTQSYLLSSSPQLLMNEFGRTAQRKIENYDKTVISPQSKEVDLCDGHFILVWKNIERMKRERMKKEVFFSSSPFNFFTISCFFPPSNDLLNFSTKPPNSLANLKTKQKKNKIKKPLNYP